MRPKKYERVWIDGKEHYIEREMTTDEYEEYVEERVRSHNREVMNKAYEIAHQNGRQYPARSDVTEAKAKVNREDTMGLLFCLAPVAVVLLLFLMGCQAIIGLV